MNQIINSFLNTHIGEYEIENLDQSSAFEHFINRLIINKYSLDRFDPSDVMTDKGEIGIDGIGIIVNDILVSDPSFIEDVLDNERRDFKVEFVFTQSKTSEKFEMSEIGNFFYGIKNFFKDFEKRAKTNDKIEELIKIKDDLYAKSIDFETKPKIDAYYVTCGQWEENNALLARIESEKSELMATQNFSEVNFYCYDSDKIITAFKELKKKNNKKFLMEKKFSFPGMEGINQAYSGLIKCCDFVELLTDDNGEILKNVFEDNVRDFQGYNSVNNEIQDTINSDLDKEKFAVLNNGITIVANRVDLTGDEVSIYDYQIVNGCQTSYVLYDNKEKLTEKMYVLAKVIEVSDDNALDRIIYTTNRQTEVKAEAFTASKPYHKKLEDFYAAMDLEYRLYYERRSKQYELSDNIKKNKVISLSTQTFSYISAFLNEPHSTHRYYGEVLQSKKGRIYEITDELSAYYVSAYLSYYCVNQFRRNKEPRYMQKYKYHIVFLMKIIEVGLDQYPASSKKFKKNCDQLMKLIKDKNKIRDVYNTAITCFREVEKETDISIEQRHRSKEFTGSLIEKVNIYNNAVNNTNYLTKGMQVLGSVESITKYFLNIKIKTDDERKKGSIHISQIKEEYIENIHDVVKLGQSVSAFILNEDYYEDEHGWELTMIKRNRHE